MASFYTEGKPDGDKEKHEHMESKQPTAMVRRVRLGNVALAAYLLGTSFVGGEGVKVLPGNAVQPCHFANMSYAIVLKEHVSHDAFSHVQEHVCPVLRCAQSARVRMREGIERCVAKFFSQGKRE